MRIVLDSSVLIASIAHPGVCSELVEEVLQDQSLVCSDYILDEVSRKLREKFHFSATDAAAIVGNLRNQCEQVHPAPVPVEACRDPKDLPVLGTAVAGQAEYLVTVDKDLLALGEFRGTQIVRPGDFWKRTRAHSKA